MHTIDLVRLRFSNLLSYGNTVNEVTFKEGITWITGSNGAGKSTILEALTLLFFNGPYRKIKKDQLKNTSNKSNLFVEGEFIRTDSKGSDRYIVSRTMNSAGSIKTAMSKNGVPIPKEASVSQKKFEDEILGFNSTIWENVISWNTINTVPFIDMEPKDKRDLMESVLVLHIDKWKELNKTAYKEALTKFESAKSDVIKYTRDATELNSIIEKMKQERADNINELKAELEILEESLVEAKQNLELITNEYNTILEDGKQLKAKSDILLSVESELEKYSSVVSLFPMVKSEEAEYKEKNIILDGLTQTQKEKKNSVDSIDSKTLNVRKRELDTLIKDSGKKVSSLKTIIDINKGNMDSITEKAKSTISGIPCHACGKLSTDDDVENIKISLREEYKALKRTNDSLIKEHSTLVKSMTSYESELDIINNSLDEYSKLYDEYSTFERNSYQPIKSSVDALIRSLDTKKTKISNAGVGTVDEATNKVNMLKEQVADKKIIDASLNDLRVKIATLKQVKMNSEKNITTIESTIIAKKSVIEGKLNNITGDSLESTIKKSQDAEKDLKTANDRVVKYSDEIELTKYIDKMCSDSGMKRIVLSTFVPNLNTAIMENMRLFDLPYSVEFDETMQYTFTSRYGLAEVYNGLSEGQKRKINFAIAMAFRDFVIRIADFKINILFLDEVLDVSTDAEALREMVMMLKNKISEIKSIYLITHRGADITECFDNKIEVTHDGRYSALKECQLTATKTKY